MAVNEEEWGPWIEHDGKGCPCEGMLVHVVRFDAPDIVVIAGAQCRATGIPVTGKHSAWVWPNGKPERTNVIRYRIRKPRGLTILESLLTDLPEKVDA